MGGSSFLPFLNSARARQAMKGLKPPLKGWILVGNHTGMWGVEVCVCARAHTGKDFIHSDLQTNLYPHVWDYLQEIIMAYICIIFKMCSLSETLICSMEQTANQTTGLMLLFMMILQQSFVELQPWWRVHTINCWLNVGSYSEEHDLWNPIDLINTHPLLYNIDLGRQKLLTRTDYSCQYLWTVFQLRKWSFICSHCHQWKQEKHLANPFPSSVDFRKISLNRRNWCYWGNSFCSVLPPDLLWLCELPIIKDVWLRSVSCQGLRSWAS